MMNTNNNTLRCHWCGISLGNASKITYLNGNLPVCDLCVLTDIETSEAEDSNPHGQPPDRSPVDGRISAMYAGVLGSSPSRGRGRDAW